MSTATRRVFLVMRHQWEYNDETTQVDDAPVLAFGDREQAEAFRSRLERRAEEFAESWSGDRYTIVEMDVTG
jgi:hypothetical protein